MNGAAGQARLLRFGTFELDLAAGELRKNGAKVRLREQPFQLLVALAGRPGEVVTREELKEKLWPADTYVDFDRSLNSAASKLRDALGDSASSPRFIETLPRRGYRFLASLEFVGDAETGGLELSTGVRARPAVSLRADRKAAEQSDPRRKLRVQQVLLAVTVVTLFAVSFVHFRREPIAPQEMPARRFSFAPEHLTYMLKDLAQAVISPNGKHIVYVAGPGDPRLWVRDLDRERPREIEGTEGARLPFWSPGSEFIGFAAGGEVKKISAQGGAAATICKLDRAYVGSSWSPDGDSIVFASGGPKQLYEVAAQGGTPRLLAEPDWSDKEPSIVLPHFLPSSSGGRTLLYAKGTLGGTEIVVWNLETGEPRVLGDGGAPVYSPTGHIIYTEPGGDLWALPFSLETLSPMGEAFPIAQEGVSPSVSDDGTLPYSDLVQGRQQLVWLDRQGKKLGAIGQPQQQIRAPRLSPDGRRVVVHGWEDSNTDVWVHEVDRPIRQRVTFHPGHDDSTIWSPSGKEVTFRSTREGHYDIYSRPLEGTGEPRLLVGTPLAELPRDWSLDGKHLLYTANDPENDLDLWRLERKQDGSGFDALPFLQTPSRETEPRFSPDGRFVVYRSDKSGRNEIYVRSFPDGANDWQVSTKGSVQPRWSHNGKELFYVEGDTLVAAAFSTRSTFTTAATTPLFQHAWFGSGHRNYDVSADGRRFVVVETLEPVEADPPSIRVVQNWFSEFKDRPGE